MAPSLVLRRARRDEVPAIVRMLADDALGSSRERPHEPLPQAYYDAFDATARDPNNQLLVAERDGEMVGTLQLIIIRGLSRMGATRAQIEAVRTAAQHRGTGLGREMVLAAIDMAREHGCALVQLTTDKARPDAHRFYQSLGFVATHEGMKLDLTAQQRGRASS
jgi:GNAT superfamily N-acetyltransferase